VVEFICHHPAIPAFANPPKLILKKSERIPRLSTSYRRKMLVFVASAHAEESGRGRRPAGKETAGCHARAGWFGMGGTQQQLILAFNGKEFESHVMIFQQLIVASATRFHAFTLSRSNAPTLLPPTVRISLKRREPHAFPPSPLTETPHFQEKLIWHDLCKVFRRNQGK
jgi:hypothetical protein